MIWQVKGDRGDDKILGLTNVFLSGVGRNILGFSFLSKLGKLKCFKFQN